MSHFTLAIFAFDFSNFFANLIISWEYFSRLYLEMFIWMYNFKINSIAIPTRNKTISFDVKILFANRPLDKTIDFILKKLYDQNKIQKCVPKTVLK